VKVNSSEKVSDPQEVVQALGTLLLSANQPLQFALHSRVLLSAKNPPGHSVTHLYVVKSANELSEIGQ
jgi:hypothetical protein